MSSYFKQVPNFDYVSRLPDAKISDYITVKNLFKRGKLADDIFQDLTIFTQYKIKGDDRPDNVAEKIYEDPDLDWIILISNNIINIQSEWPLPQRDFDTYLLDKYETYEKLNEVHHYETKEIKNIAGTTIVEEGLWVESDYSVTYYDWYAGVEKTPSSSDLIKTVTNYEYEDEIENNKRNIYILKPIYLNIIKDDLKEMMQYKKGATQYLDKTLKIAENIRLYQ